MEFTNLLDKHGWKFEAHFDGGGGLPISGRISVYNGFVYLCNTGVTGGGDPIEKFGYRYSYRVNDGSPDWLVKYGLINFRLLEPESKEGKECPECKGLRIVNDTYCPVCTGTGTIKKEETKTYKAEEPTISKEEAERHNVKMPFSESPEESIRREGAFQLLAGMLGNPNRADLSNNSVDFMTNKAIELTDLLLKKLGEC